MENYKVVFEYHGNWGEGAIEAILKHSAENLFVTMYNKFCEFTNGGLIDLGNKIWAKKHPDGNYDQEDYENHMDGFYEIACTYTNEVYPNFPLKVKLHPTEHCHICGVVKDDPTMWLTFYLKPIEEA